ncbi:glycosyltransferase family 2 protein [Chloroflexota bacterium]
MNKPRFSIVIPAFNQARFLQEAINSVLEQTYTNFELIIVNDASSDNTTEIVQQYSDPRIKYIIHEINKGLPAARNTGMRAASGKNIALLDSDDFFHPKKLEIHASFLKHNPAVDITYNPRYELNYSETTIRDLFRPPLTVGLRDLIHGYPFTPSDMVLRKDVTERVGLFDERFTAGGEDLEYPATLALAGCRFASVDRALNYRRHHSGHYRKNLDARLNDVETALTKIYSSPQCPEEIRLLGKKPLTENYIVLIYEAFVQDRTKDGQKFLHELLQFNPSVINGSPCKLVEFFANNSTANKNENHIEILKLLFDQLPKIHIDIFPQFSWAVKQGLLIKGVRASLWQRDQAAKEYFRQAELSEANFSDKYLTTVAQHLVNYEVELRTTALKRVMERLIPNIKNLSTPKQFKNFLAMVGIKRAFENYQRGKYNQVPLNVINAIRHKPAYILDRGVISIFAKSLFKYRN